MPQGLQLLTAPFHSQATNLVANDTNDLRDVFVHDLQTGATTRVSVNSDGDQATGLPLLVSDPQGSQLPSISGDGRYVAFLSTTTNLVLRPISMTWEGDTNGGADIFVHDRRTGVTSRVSVRNIGAQSDVGTIGSLNPSITPDGRLVAFESGSVLMVPGDTNDCTDIFVRVR